MNELESRAAPQSARCAWLRIFRAEASSKTPRFGTENEPDSLSGGAYVEKPCLTSFCCLW
jgi:hypothetical protein